MRVLYIYRHPAMGFSIGKVMRPIEQAMREMPSMEVEDLYLPVPNYSPRGLWRNIRAARQAVRKGHYDIVHITGAEHYLLPFLPSGPKTVVTVHDMGFLTLLHPSRFVYMGKWLLFAKTLALADKVVFISHKSRQETEQLVSIDAARTQVIPNLVGEEYHYTPKEIDTACPIILHIGTLARKNLSNTLIALRDFPHQLRVVGEVDAALQTQLEAGRWPYTCVSGLSDEDIVHEYEQCDIVNFPSLYEGFGMPIIEGQAVGRPVVTSHLPPMDEVAGEGAVLVNPHDPQSILEGYRQAVATWPSLVEKGLKNVERFRLPHIVKQYHTIYKALTA